jgi:hypothetical protein
MQVGENAIVERLAGVWRVVELHDGEALVLSYVDGRLLSTPMTTIHPVPAMTRTDDQPTIAPSSGNL